MTLQRWWSVDQDPQLLSGRHGRQRTASHVMLLTQWIVVRAGREPHEVRYEMDEKGRGCTCRAERSCLEDQDLQLLSVWHGRK
eukprot:CAMPEP_0173398828 /NCGR_PEP_ID=MMETSP1356-20130122/43064_1 /TAXON_ID=77927 ORGANISM="Hemiselmis virescens, Strain PCC157" /NCGR_SAMPLE_ID=MMETSP1356 /ASSEMBLY_ACC=CAM_ASM_000847 /LENGTH=82 /DNA_ID=CAMNT_0014358413 /DNA_START=354 /DNA_END=602 /DNA_ORIENTATION=-